MQIQLHASTVTLIDISELRDLLVRPVQSSPDISVNLKLRGAVAASIPLTVLDNHAGTKDEAKNNADSKAHHHREESGLVSRSLVGEEELWPNNISSAIRNEDLRKG